jgi:hypothetical protein
MQLLLMTTVIADPGAVAVVCVTLAAAAALLASFLP